MFEIQRSAMPIDVRCVMTFYKNEFLNEVTIHVKDKKTGQEHVLKFNSKRNLDKYIFIFEDLINTMNSDHIDSELDKRK